MFFVLWEKHPKTDVVVAVAGTVVVAVGYTTVLGIVVPTATTQNTVALS